MTNIRAHEVDLVEEDADIPKIEDPNLVELSKPPAGKDPRDRVRLLYALAGTFIHASKTQYADPVG